MKDLHLHTRREFLTRSLALAAAGATVPSFLSRTAFALEDQPVSNGGKDDPILVVLQLAGGNDGLNTIVPYAHDEYYRARPTLGVPASQVLRLNDEVGMNPELAPLKALYDEGQMALVLGAGYPNPNRSHFRSMAIWETASGADKVERYGWIGRYFDNTCSGEPNPALAVSIGPREPLTIHNPKAVGITLQNPAQYRWIPDPEKAPRLADEKRVWLGLNTERPGAPGALDFLQRTAMDAQVSSARIIEIAQSYHDSANYPGNNQLAQSLKLIASMIAGNLGSRVFFASIGSFDTHSGQKYQHTRLLNELAEAVSAFTRDLKTQGNADRVLILTFSEFGRRVQENASGGTDHGTAAPMFVFGSTVKPGIYGKQPSLTDLDSGDLKYTTDFRSVYATMLDKWLKTPSAPVLGGRFDPVAFV